MAKQPNQQASLMDMFSDFGRNLKMPNVDVDAVLSHHRKNLEALENSAKAGQASASAMFEKQREQLQATLNEIASMTRNLGAGSDPREMIQQQADFARRSFETAVKNASEVGDILRHSGSETLDILRGRIREAMDEIRRGYEKKD